MGDFDRPGTSELPFSRPQESVNLLRSEALDLLHQAKQLPKTTAEQLLDRNTTVSDLRLTSDESPFRALVSANLRDRTGSVDLTAPLGSARFAVTGGEHATGLNNYFNLPSWQRWGYQFEAKTANEAISLQVSSPHANIAPHLNFAYQATPSATIRAGADFRAHEFSFEAVRKVGGQNDFGLNIHRGPHHAYEAGVMWQWRYR